MYVKQTIQRTFFLKHNNTKEIINGIVFICFSHKKIDILCVPNYIFTYTIYVYLPTNNIIIICYSQLL